MRLTINKLNLLILRFTMKKIIYLYFLFYTISIALPSYTGYSGATGSKGTCASSCHGSGTGPITVTGFPSTYDPGKTYTISVQSSSGTIIVNFNASTRKGTTSTVAGTFAAVSKTATYSVSGYENGVRASSDSIDAGSFSWTAPAAGTGDVTFYLAGLQGSKRGPNTKIVVTSLEQSTTLINETDAMPAVFSLGQNYPNPFNPSTKIQYTIRNAGFVSLKVYDVLGHEVATLVNSNQEAGSYTVPFNAGEAKLNLASGMYFYRLEAGSFVSIKKLTLLK